MSDLDTAIRWLKTATPDDVRKAYEACGVAQCPECVAHRETIARLLHRAQAAETQLRHAEADAEQAIHYTEMERDEARAVARVLAHAYTRDSRPPQKDVDRALAYPVRAEEKGSA